MLSTSPEAHPRVAEAGEVDAITAAVIRSAMETICHRRLWVGDAWHDHAPVWDAAGLGTSSIVIGPGVIQSAFTTIVLRPGDAARVTADGDVVVEVP